MSKAYLLDTNVFADLLNVPEGQTYKVYQSIPVGQMILCAPVNYEVERGLRRTGAVRKLERYKAMTASMQQVDVIASDWQQAIDLYVYASGLGRQLSDIHLLLAALALRLSATLVTADTDFMALPLLLMNCRSLLA